MNSFPIQYDPPLFRPPSEANSLILQVTLGCSWNKCSFCEMYRSKKFSIRKEEDVVDEIKKVSALSPGVRKVFLADGDAMVLPTRRFLHILKAIKKFFPDVQRISSYALPSNILKKSPLELKELKDAGLSLIYLGIESGDDEVLKLVNKGETQASTVKGLLRAKKAGIKSSVMILSGLGGSKFSKEHAIHSAEVLNETQPEYASTLVLVFPAGKKRFLDHFGDDYIPLDQLQILEEQKVLINHCKLEKTIFRSDHASNYLILKGVLSRDKERLLREIQNAIDYPDQANLREEYERGL